MRPIPNWLFVFLFACVPDIAIAQNARRVDDSTMAQIAIFGRMNEAPAVWFETDPNLAKLRSKVQFSVLDPGGDLARQRFGGVAPTDTAVIFQQAGGRVIYSATRAQMATSSPAELYEAMRAAHGYASKAVKQPANDFKGQQICPPGQVCPPPSVPVIPLTLPPITPPPATNPAPVAPIDPPAEFKPNWNPEPPAIFPMVNELRQTKSFFTDAINQIVWLVGGVFVLGAVGFVFIALLCGLVVFGFVVSRFTQQ